MVADSAARRSDGQSYLDYYGLAEAPFSLASTPRFTCESRSYAVALAGASDAVDHRRGIVVITGEAGMGKTMLCRALLERLDARTLLSVISAPSIAADELLPHIIDDFGVSPPPEQDGGTLDFLPPAGHAVVLVEEAEQLDEQVLEELRRLASLRRGGASALQILLVGNPDLDARLQRSGKLEDGLIACRAALGPLGIDEVAPYIARRLEVAGSAEPAATFTPAAVDAVARVSGGVPRTVNLLCDRALAIGSARQMRSIDQAVILDAARSTGLVARPGRRTGAALKALAAAAVVIVIGAAAWPIASRRSTPTPSPENTPEQAPAGESVLPAADSVLLDVGSFDDAERARAVARQIADRGLPAFTRPAGGSLVVLVGPYVSRDEAVDAQRQVAALDLSGTRIVVETR